MSTTSPKRARASDSSKPKASSTPTSTPQQNAAPPTREPSDLSRLAAVSLAITRVMDAQTKEINDWRVEATMNEIVLRMIGDVLRMAPTPEAACKRIGALLAIADLDDED